MGIFGFLSKEKKDKLDKGLEKPKKMYLVNYLVRLQENLRWMMSLWMI